ncbi:hypothetical protein [Acinetobacter nosocomialis]|uniref:hypothetical protein n=1 Tax=Acinetobacter nosocomialis TaxID=106654 RepID=UPI0024DEE1BB|nr:hypothetical protein [Acinetobacter nosocomialis]
MTLRQTRYGSLLACILNKETRADYSFREWIVNTEFKEISIEELVIQANGLINQLDMILKESPASLSAKLLKEYLCTLNFENTTNSYEILGCSKIVPNSPDEGGPNYQFFWENKGKFYFLHIHLES